MQKALRVRQHTLENNYFYLRRSPKILTAKIGRRYRRV